MRTNKIWVYALGVFAVLWIHGLAYGPTEDEAYYWVLARTPRLGYAFHPPMVAWVIWFFERLLLPILGDAPAWRMAILRFPAALMTSVITYLVLAWSERVAGAQAVVSLRRGFLTLLGFAGIFGAGWMMVPDLPLFLGFTLLWISSDEVAVLGLLVGAFFVIMSKFSGVLIVVSSLVWLLFYSKDPKRVRGIVGLLIGAALACGIVLYWNYLHGFQAILYQIKERHSGSISWIRYARFWLIQILIAGPALLFYFYQLFKPHENATYERVRKLARVFAIPGAVVFLTTPLFGDFKAHWALVVWFPAACALVMGVRLGFHKKLATIYSAYGVLVVALIFTLCRIPFGFKGDPTNDMWGYRLLHPWVKNHPEFKDWPIIGSRYQTASLAFVTLGNASSHPVTMLPRDLKALDEWPNLNVTESEGPEWSKLTRPVLFIGDSRYKAGPEFKGADCQLIESLTDYRQRLTTLVEAKTVMLWKCLPKTE